MSFSVLMSLYAKERPEFLRTSLESVFTQTLRSDEVVLVLDGPITEALQSVVTEYSSKYPELKVVPIAKNGGLGKALNEGLKHCSHELVARMDTDDVCKLSRFEKQVHFMELHPEVSVVGAWIDEFVDSIEEVTSVRTLPESQAEILDFAKGRNPMNHPVVMFRKSAVLAVGSYQHFPLFEDYYLWVRMLVKSYQFYNLQESLLWFRSSPDMFKRRGGWSYAMDEVRFQKELKRLGLLSSLQMYKNIVVRFGVRVMPNSLRSLIYQKLLRRNNMKAITPPNLIM
jgi:glycosyltransferase involved in cell wall biosynthesis